MTKKTKLDYLDGKSDFYISKVFYVPAENENRFMQALEKQLPYSTKTAVSMHTQDGSINLLFDTRPKELKITCECFDETSATMFDMLCHWVAQWGQSDPAPTVGADKKNPKRKKKSKKKTRKVNDYTPAYIKERQAELNELLKQGKKEVFIADHFGVDKRTIQRWKNKSNLSRKRKKTT